MRSSRPERPVSLTTPRRPDPPSLRTESRYLLTEHILKFAQRDALKDVLEATGNALEEVRITDVKDGVFFATLVLTSGTEVSARPSDSIALALRTGSRIVCSEDVLGEAGLAVPAEQEDEVEKFREFLDHVTPEDFEAPSD